MYYFIVNEHGGSGTGRKQWRPLYRRLNEEHLSFKAYRTSEPGHAKHLAEVISRKKDDDIRIVVVGGDGTVNEVLNGIRDFSRVSLGVIPIGSGNDFAAGFVLPKKPMQALTQILSIKNPSHADLGRVMLPDGTERLFGISCGLGLDALVCRKADASGRKWILNHLGGGRLIYGRETLRQLLKYDRVNVEISIDESEPVKVSDCIYLASMNVSAEGGGVRMAPDADAFDGQLEMCMAHGVRPLAALPMFARLLAGKHTDSDKFMLNSFQTLHVRSDYPMALHTDGEDLGETDEVTIECLPGKLNLLG